MLCSSFSWWYLLLLPLLIPIPYYIKDVSCNEVNYGLLSIFEFRQRKNIASVLALVNTIELGYLCFSKSWFYLILFPLCLLIGFLFSSGYYSPMLKYIRLVLFIISFVFSIIHIVF